MKYWCVPTLIMVCRPGRRILLQITTIWSLVTRLANNLCLAAYGEMLQWPAFLVPTTSSCWPDSRIQNMLWCCARTRFGRAPIRPFLKGPHEPAIQNSYKVKICHWSFNQWLPPSPNAQSACYICNPERIKRDTTFERNSAQLCICTSLSSLLLWFSRYGLNIYLPILLLIRVLPFRAFVIEYLMQEKIKRIYCFEY